MRRSLKQNAFQNFCMTVSDHDRLGVGGAPVVTLPGLVTGFFGADLGGLSVMTFSPLPSHTLLMSRYLR